MSTAEFHLTPPFARALTLAERARLMAGYCDAVSEHAQRQIDRWRAEPAFTSAIMLEERLRWEGIDAGNFAAALAEPAALASRHLAVPTWWSDLRAAYEAGRCSETLEEDPRAGEAPVRGFLYAVRAVVARARRDVRAELERLAGAGDGPTFHPQELEDVLVASLEDRLLWMVKRPFVLELGVASLRGELAGDTPAERFRSFTERLRDAETVMLLLEEYPVLAREIVSATDRWERVNLELMGRLTADWQEIEATIFGGRDPGRLVSIDGGAGDPHRGGRSVCVLTFASGDRLVYKPRSLAVDRHLQDLLGWLNTRGFRPDFRRIALLDRETYGWSEFVSAQGCEGLQNVERFYKRLGGQLALLYALEATDLHEDNLIAAADQPILPDVEALFQPRVGGIDLRRAHEVAWAAVNHSVLRVGLLPRGRAGDDTHLDVSGIGSSAGQLTPFGVPRWEGEGTDEMRLARRRVPMRGGNNVPTVAGAGVNPERFTGAVVDGFSQMYRVLLEHRTELLADDGPLAAFAHDEVRVILRPTRTYSDLYRETFHPDVLRDAVDRDRLLDRLWLVAESSPSLVPVVPAERADLLRGDVPLFTTRPSSRDVHGSDGRFLIRDFFDEPMMKQVRSRFRALSEEDLAQQTWFIRAALLALSSQEPLPRAWSHHAPAQSEPATRDRLMDAARSVGDRLCAVALTGERDVSWIGVSWAGAERYMLAPLGVDLYGGLPGVALFLGYLSALTGEHRYAALARAAMETTRHQLAMPSQALTSVGAFEGWGGIIYALTHLAVLWNEPSLIAEANEIAATLPALIDEDRGFDVLSGAAGAAAVLVAIDACTASPSFIEIAVRAGEHLLATATELPGGIAWCIDAAGGRALAGFSHGAAGIACSLLRLGARTGEERFIDAGLRAIGFERTLFSESHANWPDLRPRPDGEPRFQTSWCHGAMGIGLARLATRELLDDAANTEIEVAVRATIAQGVRINQSLCHGSLGNLELLLEATRRLDRKRWQPHLDRLAAEVVDDLGRHGWYCGTSGGIESPGLMTGLAGIGYGLLRLADPERVPSVLMLEPPAGLAANLGAPAALGASA